MHCFLQHVVGGSILGTRKGNPLHLSDTVCESPAIPSLMQATEQTYVIQKKGEEDYNLQ